MKIEIELTKEELDKLNSISVLTNHTKKEYIESIVKREIYNNIYLVGGYIYDRSKEILSINNKSVLLTHMENKVLIYLLDNFDKYVSSDELIENIVYDKPMSIFSLRNLIKSIRVKTEKDLILSRNLKGYKANILINN